MDDPISGRLRWDTTKAAIPGWLLFLDGRPGDAPTMLSVYETNTETVVKTPGLSSPCTMECGESLLLAFGVGFTPHI